MDKILWLCNGAPLRAGNLYSNCNKRGISWIDSLLDVFYEKDDIELYIFFPIENKKDDEIKKEKNIFFYPFKNLKAPHKYNFDLEGEFYEKIMKIKPGIIHIFGTEFSHCLSMMRAVQKADMSESTVINIQGLCSFIKDHYFAFLPFKIIYKYTLRDFLRHDNILQQQKKFKARGEFERIAIGLSRNVIGRTDWDRACIAEMNPDCNYYSCHEVIRKQFYEHWWDINSCEKYSIFISQSFYPLKGFHILLKAVLILRRQYPKIKIYTTGNNPLNTKRIRENSYSQYIRKMLIHNKLENQVFFLGELNAEEMCQQYLKAHVFVSASSIENSSNSLSEAMLLGVPCVASDVGGTISLFNNREDGYMYPADEPYMLAYYINKIFEDDNLAIKFSRNARQHAYLTHDKNDIIKKMIKIYGEIKK